MEPELPLPVLDLTCLSAAGAAAPADDVVAQVCSLVAKSLRDTGCVVVRHPRVDSSENDAFLDMMEQYFSQPTDVKMCDARPEHHYQVGATPGYIETPRILVDKEMQEAACSLREGHRPTLPTGPDPKWRFFWKLGDRPAGQQQAPVVPQAFRQWSEVMNAWGQRMLDVAHMVAYAAAVGLRLQPEALSSLMHQGPHLLAPTGSDLSGALAQEGKVFAGFHYDLNFLTLHGRSRFPGLFVWLRDGRRVPVRVPEGCLFVQAGKQLEWLTGGEVMAGMHEVVVTADTLQAVERARSEGRPTWRVSSTVFSHVASHEVLRPLGPFATASSLAAYPPTTAGEQVQRELEAIKLKKTAAAAAVASEQGPEEGWEADCGAAHAARQELQGEECTSGEREACSLGGCAVGVAGESECVEALVQVGALGEGKAGLRQQNSSALAAALDSGPIRDQGGTRTAEARTG